MLFESDVVDAVCIELQARGYHIQQRLRTREKGDDIVAVRGAAPVRQLFIEAKGETSSNRDTRRYGRPFDAAQIRVHVAEALYKAATVLSREREGVEIRAGIALPDTKKHRARIADIERALRQLAIAVFWVDEGGGVQVASPWQL
jgi:diaminopimelate decarboxylase